AVGALAEGLGIRAVARVFEVDPNTVLQWLVEVADHATAFSRYFLHDVRVTQVQLEELFALLSAVKAGEVSEAEAITRLARSPHWVWTAMDPVTKLLLTIDIGDRTLAMAQRVVHPVVQVLAPGCAPLFLTDGFKEYATALLTHCGQWVQPPRRQDQGPYPQGHLVFHFNPDESQRLYRLGRQPAASCRNVRMACPPQQAHGGVAQPRHNRGDG